MEKLCNKLKEVRANKRHFHDAISVMKHVYKVQFAN